MASSAANTITTLNALGSTHINGKVQKIITSHSLLGGTKFGAGVLIGETLDEPVGNNSVGFQKIVISGGCTLPSIAGRVYTRQEV